MYKKITDFKQKKKLQMYNTHLQRSVNSWEDKNNCLFIVLEGKMALNKMTGGESHRMYISSSRDCAIWRQGWIFLHSQNCKILFCEWNISTVTYNPIWNVS